MKRLLLAIVPVGVVLAVAFALQVFDAGQTPACCAEAACKGKSCCQTAGRAKSDAEVVAELVAILDRTKSTDTYLATLLALSQFEDKSPLPAVVRNAARLGLLKGLTKEEKPSHAQEMIGAYLSGEMSVASQVANRGQYSPPPGYPTAYPMSMPSPYGYPPACVGQPYTNGLSVPTPLYTPPASGYKPEPVGMPVPCNPPATTPPTGTSSEKLPACPVDCHTAPVSAVPANESKEDRAQIFSFWQGFSR